MCLSLETLISIKRTYKPIPSGTDRLVELGYDFSITNDLAQMANFPTWIPDCDCICSAMAFLSWEYSDDVLSQFLLTFCQTEKGKPRRTNLKLHNISEHPS